MSSTTWTKYGDMSGLGEKTRRRGARVGVLIALMAAVPGLVAGTAFISGGSGGTLAGTPTIGASWCGFAESPNILDSAYLGSITLGTRIGTGTPAIYSSITFAPVNLPTGAGGYEYLDGEFLLGCSGTPSAGSHTVSVGYATTVSWTGSVTQSTVFVEQMNNPATPDFKYCTPGGGAGLDPTAADAAWNSGLCSGSSIADPACASLYLPNDGDIAAGNWWAYSMTAVSAACAGSASMTTSSTIAIANSIATTSVDVYGAVSFGIAASSASAASGTFTLSAVTA